MELIKETGLEGYVYVDSSGYINEYLQLFWFYNNGEVYLICRTSTDLKFAWLSIIREIIFIIFILPVVSVLHTIKYNWKINDSQKFTC